MLYHLFKYLQQFDVPGAHLMDYITFRAGIALALSLFIAIVVGGPIIRRLRIYYARQGGENQRDLDNAGKITARTNAIQNIQQVLDNMEETNLEKKADVAKCLEKDRKAQNLTGNMISEGTTPRRLTDLIGSLADLTSGSGDKGTPIVLIQGYFDNYSKD